MPLGPHHIYAYTHVRTAEQMCLVSVEEEADQDNQAGNSYKIKKGCGSSKELPSHVVIATAAILAAFFYTRVIWMSADNI